MSKRQRYGGLGGTREGSRYTLSLANSGELLTAIQGCTKGIELALAEGDEDDIKVMCDRINTLVNEIRQNTLTKETLS